MYSLYQYQMINSEAMLLVLSCPFCDVKGQSLQHHLQQQCVTSINIQEKKKASLIYKGGISVCLRCFQQMKSPQMRDHLRSCKRNFEKSVKERSSQISSVSALTHQQKDKNAPQTPLNTPKSQMISSTNLTQCVSLQSLESNTIQLFQNFLLYSTQPFLIQWINDHCEFRKIFLYSIFQKFVGDMQQKLNRRIPRIQWSDFGGNLRNFEWNKAFRRPEQVFDRQFLLDLIKDYEKQVRSKILMRVNKIYSKYPNLYEKFKIQHQQSAPKHIPKPLCHIQLIQIIGKLLETKLSKYVHISLDLMILFQAGQRYPSAIPLIQQVLIKYLNNSSTSLFFKTSKTQKHVLLILSAQLIQMLRQFKWKGFYCCKRYTHAIHFYARISRYLPFTIYAIRHGYMCYLELMQSAINKDTINLLSQHSKKQNFNLYTQSVVNKRLQSYKNLLKFPNCKIGYQSKEQILAKLPKTDQLYVKIHLRDDWFANFFKQMEKDDQSTECFDFLHISVNFAPPIPQIENDKVQQANQGVADQGFQSQSEQGIQKKQVVIINGKDYTRINDAFDLATLMHQVKGGVCSKCFMKIQKKGFECKYCGDQFHQNIQCRPEFCQCLQFNTDKKGLTLQSFKKQQLKLKLNQQYVDRNISYLKQVRFLTHARGFAYTHTSVCHQTANNFSKQILQGMMIGEVKLKGYELYRQLRYFPPLKLKITNIDNQNGTGFGLEADEVIERHTFIGQYAADIILRSQTYLLRRNDMTMCLAKQLRSSQCLQIAPLKYNSFCTLINEDKLNPNCQAKLCIVENQIKVILYTLTKINKGVELTYNYNMILAANASQQVVTIENSQESDVEVIDSMERDKGIFNYGKNCYINCILQLLRTFQSYFKVLQTNQQPFFMEIKRLYSTQIKFDPARIISLATGSGRFSRGCQQDAHDFLDYCIAQFQSVMPINFIMGLNARKVVCSTCSTTNQSIQPFRQVLLLPNESIYTISKKVAIPSDYLCDNDQCKQLGSSTVNQTIISWPELLLVYVLRFKKNIKDRTQVDLPPKFSVQNITYEISFIVLHHGLSIKNGHYTAINYKKGELYNDQNVFESIRHEKQDIYMAIYEKNQ